MASKKWFGIAIDAMGGTRDAVYIWFSKRSRPVVVVKWALGQSRCEGLFLCKDTTGRRYIALIEPCTRFYAFRLKKRHGEAVISHVFPDTGK